MNILFLEKWENDPYVEVISWIQASTTRHTEDLDIQEFSSSEEDDKPSEKSKHSHTDDGNESEDESEDDSDNELPVMKNKFAALPAD